MPFSSTDSPQAPSPPAPCPAAAPVTCPAVVAPVVYPAVVTTGAQDKGSGVKKSLFFLGLITGGVLVAVMPRLSGVLMPLTKKSVKGGVLAGRRLKAMAAEIREDIEDITAEAISEIDK